MGSKKIIACYLTGFDPQRDITSEADKEDYIRVWYDSISFGYSPVIIHNSLSDSFISKFPKAEFVKVPDPHCQLYDYRWLTPFDYVRNNKCDVVFITDISDVVMVSEPVIKPNTLYCGDEEKDMTCWMVVDVCEPIRNLSGYMDMLADKERQMLNCGVVGGDYYTMLSLLTVLSHYINTTIDRPVNKCVDMPIFNYVVWKFFPECVHGVPVNSVFKKEEIRDDVWFKHK